MQVYWRGLHYIPGCRIGRQSNQQNPDEQVVALPVCAQLDELRGRNFGICDGPLLL